MPQHSYDRSSKWLLANKGAALLYLGGARNVRSCRALQAEIVQPRKLPDGLLEATFGDQSGPQLTLVEIATYPEKRVPEQVAGNLRLVRQARGVLPDALVLVLCPKGKYRVPQEQTIKSKLGWSEETYRWKVVELWTLSAEDLLAAGEVGLVPFVPLTQFEGPPEPVLRRCREHIDRDGGEFRENLLAVAQVMTRLRFDVPECLALFGGRKVMIESPLIRELREEFVCESGHKLILEWLQERLGQVPGDVESAVRQLKEPQMKVGLRLAAYSADYPNFLEQLRREVALPAKKEKSTRGRRKP